MRLTSIIGLNLISLVIVASSIITESLTVWSWGFLCWLVALIIMLLTEETYSD